MVRPTWDEYFLKILRATSLRATCDRGKCSCVITRDDRLLVTGYVGSPNGMDHCDDAGHFFHKVWDETGKETEHCVRTVHAEQNAICDAARRGIPLCGGTLYVTMEPCYTCAKMIIQCGIKRVVSLRKYKKSKDTRELFVACGIAWEVLGEEMKYDG